MGVYDRGGSVSNVGLIEEVLVLVMVEWKRFSVY